LSRLHQPYNDQSSLVLLRANSAFIFLVTQYAVLSELDTIGDGMRCPFQFQRVIIFTDMCVGLMMAGLVHSLLGEKHLLARERKLVVQLPRVPRCVVHQSNQGR